jgi:hypothetical protein
VPDNLAARPLVTVRGEAVSVTLGTSALLAAAAAVAVIAGATHNAQGGDQGRDAHRRHPTAAIR